MLYLYTSTLFTLCIYVQLMVVGVIGVGLIVLFFVGVESWYKHARVISQDLKMVDKTALEVLQNLSMNLAIPKAVNVRKLKLCVVHYLFLPQYIYGPPTFFWGGGGGDGSRSGVPQIFESYAEFY